MANFKTKPIVYDLEKDNHFMTKVSTNTTAEIPDVVFLRAKIRITPIIEKKTYVDEILSIKNDFEEFTKDTLDNLYCYYSKNYIFTTDVAEKSVRYKKTTHFRYDIYLKSKTKWTLSEHKEYLKKLSDKLDNYLTELFNKHFFKSF